MSETLDFYNLNADDFVNGTISVDFSDTQNKFIKKLNPCSRILDFGCGSGRDTKYFLENGFNVDATDGSIELCKSASLFTGIKVKNMLFQELSEVDRYDGIWACASILHLSKDELIDVFDKMVLALKKNGIIYTSFKYGEFEGTRNGRYFTDFTENTFKTFVDRFSDIAIEDFWITQDVRPQRDNEKWLNVILRK